MYKKVEDFILEWEEEAKSTLVVFKAIDDDVVHKKINDNVRSLDRIAWHITRTLTEMPSSAKIISEDALDNKKVPESIKSISDMYKQYSGELVSSLRKNWKDSDLTEIVELYNQKWQRSKVLSILIKHQIHHRAQMTIIMRMLDLKVPGIYGPAKEEWNQFGMEPQE